MIVVDVETTGLDPEKHSIVSIGAVDFFNSKNEFYGECGITSSVEISAEALAINGFTEEKLRDHKLQSDRDLVVKFLLWTKTIENQILAGHNTDFDRRFIQTVCKRYGLEWRFGHRVVDLHSIACAYFLQRNLEWSYESDISDLNADNIFTRMGLCCEPRPHNALVGAKMETEALYRLIYGISVIDLNEVLFCHTHNWHPLRRRNN